MLVGRLLLTFLLVLLTPTATGEQPPTSEVQESLTALSQQTKAFFDKEKRLIDKWTNGVTAKHPNLAKLLSVAATTTQQPGDNEKIASLNVQFWLRIALALRILQTNELEAPVNVPALFRVGQTVNLMGLGLFLVLSAEAASSANTVAVQPQQTTQPALVFLQQATHKQTHTCDVIDPNFVAECHSTLTGLASNRSVEEGSTCACRQRAIACAVTVCHPEDVKCVIESRDSARRAVCGATTETSGGCDVCQEERCDCEVDPSICDESFEEECFGNGTQSVFGAGCGCVARFHHCVQAQCGGADTPCGRHSSVLCAATRCRC